jgi:hypothetical protein
MTKPMIRIHNTETDEVIDREMTKAEFDVYTLNLENYNKVKAERKAEAQAKATAKAALLDRLGITAEEAVLLLS